jgi:hypothetical protein
MDALRRRWHGILTPYLLTTHYPPLTTHHSPLATRYSLLTTHHSLLATRYYSLQVVATLLGWVVLSVASVIPSRLAPWASSSTLLWVDKCCINQESPETIKV